MTSEPPGPRGSERANPRGPSQGFAKEILGATDLGSGQRRMAELARLHARAGWSPLTSSIPVKTSMK